MAHGIRKVEEKNIASEIQCMVWNDRIDIVAVSNAKGEVSMHRLSWTRADHIEPLKAGLTVKKLAWRPDGKMLLIAYSDGNVRVVNTEKKVDVTTFPFTGELSFVTWVEEKGLYQSEEVLKLGIHEEMENSKVFEFSKPYLRDPPAVSDLEGAILFDDIKHLRSFMQNQAAFNLLVMGTQEGTLSIYIFGCWKCVTINVSDKIGYKCSIKDAQFTDDLSKMFVTVIDEYCNVNTIVLGTFIFKDHTEELYHVSMKYIKLYELVCYLEKIIVSITETWESILLEIDTKLAKYASQVPEGGVTADFLELLLCGVCSERLEEFLICELTKKGLEKFGQTMEVSYSSIQSFLFKHIIKFSQNSTFHLSELKGMAAFKDRFEPIGLNEDLIRHAIRATGAFIIKASEMQQIINTSVLNYKCFFRWLYAAFMNLLEEPIPLDVQKVTQQDLACIAEFIQNFDRYGQTDDPSDQRNFTMERIGQYLLNQDLKIKPDMTGNDWTALMAENQCLRDHPSMIPHYPEKSLIQVYNELKNSIEKVFVPTMAAIDALIVPVFQFRCFNFATPDILMSSINVSNDLILLALVQPSKSIHLIQVHFNHAGDCEARAGSFHFIQQLSIDPENPADPSLNVLDLHFYSKDILSLLLEECVYTRRACLFQLSIPLTIEHLKPFDLTAEFRDANMESVNAWNLAPRRCKMVDMLSSKIAVSGARRVCILLSQNKRKVKLYEMECDEDDDEDDIDMSLLLKDDFHCYGIIPD